MNLFDWRSRIRSNGLVSWNYHGVTPCFLCCFCESNLCKSQETTDFFRYSASRFLKETDIPYTQNSKHKSKGEPLIFRFSNRFNSEVCGFLVNFGGNPAFHVFFCDIAPQFETTFTEWFTMLWPVTVWLLALVRLWHGSSGVLDGVFERKGGWSGGQLTVFCICLTNMNSAFWWIFQLIFFFLCLFISAA